MIPPMSSADDSPHQPHDKLFKLAFGDPETAAGLLRAELPAELAAAIEWKSLHPEAGSFIDSQLRASETDLLFSARIAGREAMLYLLFEHQSTREPRMMFRLLRYMSRIWESLSPRHPWPAKLPPILPVVLFQNGEKWDIPASLAELLDIPPDLDESLRPFIPDFMCRQLQLAGMDYEAIPGTDTGVYVLQVMKAERLRAIEFAPIWDEARMLAVDPHILKAVLRYIYHCDVDKSVIEGIFKNISNRPLRTTAMTLAQAYRQEGEAKGRQEGRQEGRLISLRETILEVLKLRFDSVPEGIGEAIDEQSDEAKLRQLHRHAIQCLSLESFATEL